MIRTSVTIFAALALTACAHQSEQHVRGTTTTSVAAPEEREVIAIVDPPPADELPRARPKLTQTVTLGQGSSDAQYTGPTPPPQGRPDGQAQPNVVINNTIVNQPPPVYGYGYGGYGYRGYGYGASRAASSFGSGASRPSWGTTGWEGARRTAAPGQTPGVGGNWAPAPSYGPAPMR